MDPTSMNLNQTIYFAEGQGYYFIQSLGRGAAGTASLVRSVKDGKLYVRKEPFLFGHVKQVGEQYFTRTMGMPDAYRPDGYMKTESITEPPKEYTVGGVIRQIRDVCNIEGWTKHVDTAAKTLLCVTYWQFYNGGCLNDICQLKMALPEYWVCYLLTSMARTLTQTHDIGIIHEDAHIGNWLIEHSKDLHGDKIRLVLADFDQSIFEKDITKIDDWIRGCQHDYRWLVDIAVALMQVPWTRFVALPRLRDRLIGSGLPCSKGLWALLQELYTLTRSTTAPNRFPGAIERWMEKLNAHFVSLKQVNWPLLFPLTVKQKYTPLQTALASTKTDALKYWQIATIAKDGSMKLSEATAMRPTFSPQGGYLWLG